MYPRRAMVKWSGYFHRLEKKGAMGKSISLERPGDGGIFMKKVLKWIGGILVAIGGIISAYFIGRSRSAVMPDDDLGELAGGVDNDLGRVRAELRRDREGINQSREGVRDIRSGVKRGKAATRRLRQLMARIPNSN
jgi:hypothetical protein